MKKLLFMLSLIAVVCLFALTVFAVEKDGIYYDLKIDGENAIAIVNTENRTQCTLETVKIPATIDVDGVTYKVTEIAQNAFGQVNGDVNGFIKHLIIGENVSVVGQHAFRRVTSLETVTINNTNATDPIDFNNAQFMACKNLVSVVAKDAKISAYGGNCFDGCSMLETVDFPSTLTSIGTRAFTDCVLLASADLSNTKVTSIGSWAFGSCKAMTSIKFPSTLTSISNNNFLYCPIEMYVFPHSMKSFGKDMLAHQSVIKVLVMPKVDENTTGVNNFLYTTKPNVIIYAGDNVDYFKSLSGNFSAYDVQPFENYVPGTTYATNTIFYGAKTCENCNGLLGEKGFVFDDLLSDMGVGQQCTNCGIKNLTEEFESVFVDLGYSVANFGGVCSIMQGFKVNFDSIDAYNENVSEGIFELGVLAVAEYKVGDTAFDENGKALNGVISYATLARNDFLEIKITGLSADGVLANGTSHLDVGLHLCAYVKAGDKIYYISDGYVGEKLGNSVKYNDIVE